MLQQVLGELEKGKHMVLGVLESLGVGGGEVDLVFLVVSGIWSGRMGI